MLKKLFLLAFCFCSACTLSGGSNEKTSDSLKKMPCPNVVINRAEAYLSQIQGYTNPFKIELYGYEGYCWFDAKTKQPKASLTPLFKLIRLDGGKAEAFVMFDWFYRTSEGPTAFLGEKTFAEQTTVPASTQVYKFRGKAVNVRVPTLEDSIFQINLGLRMTNQEKQYNDTAFDLN